MNITDWLLLVVLLVQFVVIWSVWNLTDMIKKLTDLSKEDDTVRKATTTVNQTHAKITFATDQLEGKQDAN